MSEHSTSRKVKGPRARAPLRDLKTRLRHVLGRARLPRTAHGLAHLCVCVVAICAWAAPRPVVETRRAAAYRIPLTEEAVDAELQRAARASLGGREGTILVMDAATGRLRAVVNSRLAFAGAAAPGSTVKAFTLLAALRAGLVQKNQTELCRGRFERDDFKIACTHPHAKLNFTPARALAHSCNHFFGAVGERLDRETFNEVLSSFGFGAPTGGGESEGVGELPRGPWATRDALGETAQLLVTPAQLLTAYAALFNGGSLLVPQLAAPKDFVMRERARLDVDYAHRELLMRGMRGAVAYGTAARAGIGPLPQFIFGKTGTSTPDGDFRPQGWFVGFAAEREKNGEAPRPEDARLAVLVYLKRGQGSDAARVARTVFEEYGRLRARDAEGRRELLAGGVEEWASEGEDAGDASGRTLTVRLSGEDATVRVPLEAYVFGVLAGESSFEDEREALKAQAVVSRTYALRNLRRHAREGFDLCDSTHCQRFVRAGDESSRPDFYALLRRVVSETAGQTLRDRQGRVAEVYFSASCGGMTSDLSKLWDTDGPPPVHLRGVRDDACATESHARWTDAIPAPKLLKALQADERSDVGARLDAVRVLSRDHTGRVERIALEGERRRVLRGWDFKIIVGRTLGWNVLRSSRFDVSRAGLNFVFRGGGFGHGLGTCQAGSHVMAARGATYRQILEKYLPGTTLDGGSNLRVGGTSRHELTADESNAEFNFDETAAARSSSWATGMPSGASSSHSYVFRPAVFLRTEEGSVVSQAKISYGIGPAPSRQTGATRRLTLSSENFRVSYPAKSSRREVEGVLRALESARADLSARLSAASLNAGRLPNTEVFVHGSTGDFVGSTGQAHWVAAVTRGRRIETQPLDVLRRRGVLERVLRHEYAHVVLESLGRGRAPRWLVEGLAIHFAGEAATLARAEPKTTTSLEELDRRLASPATSAEMRALYAAAYREVAALIRREGEAGAWRRALRGAV